MSSTHPYYRRPRPGPFHIISNRSDYDHVDFRFVRLPFYDSPMTVDEAVRRFDARTAEFVRASVGRISDLSTDPVFTTNFKGDSVPLPSLLEKKSYHDDDVLVPTERALGALAYVEYFPYDKLASNLPSIVSAAILKAEAGGCGSFGASSDVVDAVAFLVPPFGGNIAAVASGEGNYDLSQMHLLQIVYRYYDDLSPEAQEHLVHNLLALGKINRPNAALLRTSGGPPEDWDMAGYVTIPPTPPLIPSPLILVDPIPETDTFPIGETENHILQIHTARYLTNQLLYEREHHNKNNDNRRNGPDGGRSCTDLMLYLLRNFLKDDFSEYNAKSYQDETRNALRNLCSYAYDHEVRLAARMVLDYLSAKTAVSSCDLRRLLPFRRRNEKSNSTLIDNTYMDVGLLDWQDGADRAAEPFAVQTGNLRAYNSDPHGSDPPQVGNPLDGTTSPRPAWCIPEAAGSGLMEGLGDYRLPYSIHDLFVTDSHRRFFQRVHRTVNDVKGSRQNVDNMEIYAGSPSYLITAGGSPAPVAINPGPFAIAKPELRRTQIGVAVTTSFIPTGDRAGVNTQYRAKDLIQFGQFAEGGSIANYGVAPDFACGHLVYLPAWFKQAIDAEHKSNPALQGSFSFVNKGDLNGGGPGFFLALFQEGDFAVLEAYDTWLHPGLSFTDFKESVWTENQGLQLKNNVEAEYRTQNGNHVHFVIWNEGNVHIAGAQVNRIELSAKDPTDSLPDRDHDASKITNQLVNGTILNSPSEAVVEITNPFLRTKITLDMSDQWHPRRVDEDGKTEVAGFGQEVWVDFDWAGPLEGDYFHPFNTLAAAVDAVADGGVIKIVPGSTKERPFISTAKKIRIEAAVGGVVIGRR